MVHLLFLFWLWSCSPAQAEGPASDLRQEVMLHPLDSFTAFTLHKNEFVYNQSPFTLPLPSWAWWGVTDWLTAEIDTLPLLGGLFEKPFLPVPSFNFRFRLNGGMEQDFALAFETMYQYLYEANDQAKAEHLEIERRYSSWSNRLNASFRLGPQFWLHASAGATYAENFTLMNKKRSVARVKAWRGQFHPDVSVAADWRWKPWVSLHTSVSYGDTFVYLDNVPRKFQVAYGFRLAPFLRSHAGFWHNMRCELAALYIAFPDVAEHMAVELPVFPYVYWQWRI